LGTLGNDTTVYSVLEIERSACILTKGDLETADLRQSWFSMVGTIGRMTDKMKSIPRAVWIVPAILLVIATARLYGYCTFLRIVTCGIAAWIAYAGFQEGSANNAWSIVLALIAVLFNPILPIHLDRRGSFSTLVQHVSSSRTSFSCGSG